MSFDLSGYVTVDERIEHAKQEYPDGRFTTELLDLPDAFAGQFVAVKARFYRSADDPVPGEGVAWEPVPGKTPYTRDSELMNAETSAWGRALVAALVADAKKGIASQQEVRNRRPQAEGPPCPDCGGATYDNTEKNRDRKQQGKRPMPVFKCQRCDWVDWEGTTGTERISPDFDVAEWAGTAVQQFSQWSPDRRREEWRNAVGELFRGEQPTGEAAAQEVIEAMAVSYYAEHGDERPF